MIKRLMKRFIKWYFYEIINKSKCFDDELPENDSVVWIKEEDGFYLFSREYNYYYAYRPDHMISAAGLKGKHWC
jgi:hypothetical protein